MVSGDVPRRPCAPGGPPGAFCRVSQSEEDIDALLEEVSALANEAVADVSGGNQPSAPGQPQQAAQTLQQTAVAGHPGPAPGRTGQAATGQRETRPRPPGVRGASSGRAGASSYDAGAVVADEPARETDVTAGRQDHLERILRLEVPVIVQLAERRMPLREIMGLTTGAIIEFEKPSDADLELMINNKRIGHGQPVKVGENFGLRVSRIESVRDRIKALVGR